MMAASASNVPATNVANKIVFIAARSSRREVVVREDMIVGFGYGYELWVR